MAQPWTLAALAEGLAPTWQLTILGNPALGDLIPYSGLLRYWVHMVHICTCKQNAHTHKIKSNKNIRRYNPPMLRMKKEEIATVSRNILHLPTWAASLSFPRRAISHASSTAGLGAGSHRMMCAISRLLTMPSTVCSLWGDFFFI